MLDRDAIAAKHILEKDHASSHLGAMKYDGVSFFRKKVKLKNPIDSITLIICPAWGNIFPPYNLARLSSVLRYNNYDVNIFDLNIESWNYLKDKTELDYWEGNQYFMWDHDEYNKVLHPLLYRFLSNAIKKILGLNDKIIGFSLYSTNRACSFWMIKKIKQLRPDIKIVMGGPENMYQFSDEHQQVNLQAHFKNLVDYVVIGEGEHQILDIMKTYKKVKSDKAIFVGDLKSKIDLNELPFPDYTDYDLNKYRHKNGASLETSRGCIASCTFCSEVQFWKFRTSDSNKLIEEIKYQIEEYDFKRLWFIDSLVNGNLKTFRDLLESIVKEGIDISWNGYARCDGRMDKEFFQLINDSGCTSLSFGVESGSPVVLLDMKKNIDTWEIESNLKHGHEVGMFNHVNWIIGFPTETPLDFYHSLGLLYNCNEWIHNISPGAGCGIAPLTDLHLDRNKYGISEYAPIFGEWTTSDFTNTLVHRILRIIFMNSWLNPLSCFNAMEHIDLLDAVNIKCEMKPKIDRMFQHLYDFKIFKSEDGYISTKIFKSLLNEYVMFCFAYYTLYGEVEMKIKLDKETMIREFGGRGKWYESEVYLKLGNDMMMDIKVNQKLYFSRSDRDVWDIEKDEYSMEIDTKVKVGQLLDDYRSQVNYIQKETVYDV
jgi:predicted DNA-binding ArsR family transcriptional regulator